MFSFLEAFSPTMMLVNLLGSALGLVWGAMPALSTTMALSIMVGLTYNWSTDIAISFLIGIYVSSVFGGSISAIFINIPGTPAAVMTALAGHPLFKKGRGTLALCVAFTASLVGNWAGVLALICLLPLIMALALKFTSWELALLAFWGVAICGTLTAKGESSLKGWVSGFLGLLIATVGREDIYGFERFTFGSKELLTGIPYVPVLIGLFGLTEIFCALSERSPKIAIQKYDSEGIFVKFASVLEAFKITFKYWKTVIRSSLIGILIGAIPAAGENIASFVSYGVGERITKKKFAEEGHEEGVVCSEVANNACIGGAYLPTLVLGIPGSPPTAAFLAALMLHGIIFGPNIDHEQPGLLYFIYGVLIFANIALYLVSIGLIKPIINLFSLPRELLLPGIMLFCVVGSFTERISMFDIYLMFGFGFLGFIMRKTGFGVTPLVLGVVLGDIMDQNLRRALVVFENASIWEVLSRPIGTALVIIIIFTFVSVVFKKKVES